MIYILVWSNDGTSEICVFVPLKSESTDISPSDGVERCFVGIFVLLLIDIFWSTNFSITVLDGCWERVLFNKSCEWSDDDIDGNLADVVAIVFDARIFSNSSI